MRLENYLTEKVINDKTVEIIQKIRYDCRPFLKKLGNEHVRLLYRGSHHRLPSYHNIKKFIPRKHRMPSDMNKRDHDMFNKSFYKKFGWKPRSEGVFCTGNEATASGYGDAYIFFPIGDFEFLWSPKIRDLYDHVHTRKPIGSILLKDFFKEAVGKYINSGLVTAITSGHEIMVRCNSYYLTNMDRYDVIKALSTK